MQGWHDKQVGVRTQPCPLPLFPRGPNTTQGLSLWLLTLIPPAGPNSTPHILLESTHTRHLHSLPTPSRVPHSRLAGASVSPPIPRLRSLPPPALSSDYPGKWGPEWSLSPSLSPPGGRWPLVPTAFQFRFSKLPSFPHLSVTRLAQRRPPSLRSLHTGSPAPQAFKSAWPLPMVTQVPSPLRAVGGAEARLGTHRWSGQVSAN